MVFGMKRDPVREYLSKLGKRGAKVTNSQLTVEERIESARRAAQARWAKQKQPKQST
jgi:hypothetical protein